MTGLYMKKADREIRLLVMHAGNPDQAINQ